MLQRRTTSNGVRIAVLALIGAGFLVRLLWAGHFPNGLYADSDWYYKQAVSLAQNHGYLYQGQPSAIWPVGYPFVLSLFFRIAAPSLEMAKLQSVLLLTLDLALIYRYAQLAAGQWAVALATLAIMAFAPSYVLAGSLVASEPVFVCGLHLLFVVTLVAIRDDRTWHWLATGMLTGLLMYVRPEAGVYLLIVLGALMLVRRKASFLRTIALAGAITGSVLLVLLPWTVRNWTQLGLFVPVSTTGCMNLWIGHSPFADGGFVWPRDPAINPTVLREDDTEQIWYQRSCAAAQAAILSDPGRVVALWPHKIYELWATDDSLVHWNFAGVTDDGVRSWQDQVYRLVNWYYLPLLALGLAMICWRLGQWAVWLFLPARRANPQARPAAGDLFGIAVLILTTLVYLPFFGDARFHFGVLPVLVVFAVQPPIAGARWLVRISANRRIQEQPPAP